MLKISFLGPISLLLISVAVHANEISLSHPLSQEQIHRSPALSEIVSNNHITIGYRESSIPFSYLDLHQKPIGYSIDLCHIIIENLKILLNKPSLGINYVPITSQNRLLLLKNGTIQMDCGSTSNLLSREKQASFSVTTYVSDVKIMVKKNAAIKNFSDLDGKTVVTTSGTSSDVLIRKAEKNNHIHVKIIYGKDHTNSFLMLKSGRASAFVMDSVLLQGFLKNTAQNEKDFTILNTVLRSEPYAITLPKDDLLLKSIVDASLKSIMADKQIDALYKKWFQSSIPPYNINLQLAPNEAYKEAMIHPSDKGIADF